jgi:hypothetical protein
MLKYDISKVPDNKKVIDIFPELSEYKEFSNKKEDLLLRIAILATDEGSDFVRLYRDDYERKIVKIFEYLKIDNEPLLENIVKGVEYVFNNMVNRYFIMCDNLAYVMWSDKLKNFHYIGTALRGRPDMNNLSVDMSKRATLGKQQQEIYKELIELEAQIFPDDFTRRVVKEQVAKILQLPEKFANEKAVI